MNEEFWKKFPPIPGFDCLKMKDEIQSRIYGEIKELSPEERVAYFNQAGARLRQAGLIQACSSVIDPVCVKEEVEPYKTKQPSND